MFSKFMVRCKETSYYEVKVDAAISEYMNELKSNKKTKEK